MDIFTRVKSAWPLRGGVNIDDQFDHHNRSFMFVFLTVCGFVITVRQYTGKVISCSGFKKFEKDFVEDYCWTQGLYTVREAYNQPEVNVPFPGVMPEDVPTCFENPLYGGDRIHCPDPSEVLQPDRIYHLWYQWVPFYFYLAAVSFYLPYLLLKNLGFGDIKPVIRMLRNPVETRIDLEKMIDRAVTWLYIKTSIYYTKKSWFARVIERHWLGVVLITIKLLFLIFSIAVFYLTSRIFKLADFKWYGYDFVVALYTNDSSATAVQDRLFPKMVACEIKRWGASGLEEENGMCVLAPNVINQYLFLLAWFCYVITICLNVISLFMALFKLPLPRWGYWRFLLKSYLRDDDRIREMYDRMGLSGRLILHILASNVPPQIFERLVRDLSRQLLDPKYGGINQLLYPPKPSAYQHLSDRKKDRDRDKGQHANHMPHSPKQIVHPPEYPGLTSGGGRHASPQPGDGASTPDSDSLTHFVMGREGEQLPHHRHRHPELEQISMISAPVPPHHPLLSEDELEELIEPGGSLNGEAEEGGKGGGREVTFHPDA